MPMYTSCCPKCNIAHFYVTKIEDRYNTPSCGVCGGPTEKMIDAPMIQAQTISGIITSSDGYQHEGSVAFEKHLEKNNLIHGSDAKAEAESNRKRIDAEIKQERRTMLEKLIK